jgi:hypothetical protein
MRGGFMGDVVSIKNARYATEEDVQKMIDAIQELKEMLENK